MLSRALDQQQHISLEAVELRARRFPTLAGLLSTDIGDLTRTRLDSSPRLLVMLGETGSGTGALLSALEDTVKYFDVQPSPGWHKIRRRLGAANQRHDFLAIASELVVARWLVKRGLQILEFEPETDGNSPDLLIALGSDQLLVEIAAPGPPADAIDHRNGRLIEGLRRVASGLYVEVEGYNAGRPMHSLTALAAGPVADKDIDAVVHEFRRSAALIDRDCLPVTVVEGRPDQPVSITAIRTQPATDRTSVILYSSEVGLVPNVGRLVDVVRRERKHLPSGTNPGAIFVDLSRWPDFREPGYYLDSVQARLARHRLPAFVGTYAWQSDHFEPGLRSCLGVDASWQQTSLGHALTDAWA